MTVLYIALGALALLALLLWLTAEYFFSFAIKRMASAPNDFADVLSSRLSGTDREYLLRDISLGKRFLAEGAHEDVTVRSRDGLTLCGRLYLSPNADTTVIFVHGHKSAAEVDFPVHIRRYHSLGYNVLAIDHRASGKSEGKYYCFGALERYDVEDWCGFVRERLGDRQKLVLFGCSMGGATVLMSSELPLVQGSVSCIIADCPYSSPKDEFTYILKSRYHLPAFPVLPVAEMLTKHRAGWSFDSCSAKKAVGRTSVPVLLIHGTADRYVPADFSLDIFESRRGICELLLVDSASHGYSVYQDPIRYFAKADAFIRKFGED